jgi:threonine dehydrogenase-like Zn-dependent dehydrogenase
VRFEPRDAPTIFSPTDAIIRIAATCVCGSDLWPYRGLQPIDPGKVFDLTLPLSQVAEGYRAMDEGRAIKTLLRP